MNIKGILTMEWVQLWRSPMRWSAIIVYLALGAYAVFSGQQYVQKWAVAIDKVELEEKEMAEQALFWYAEGVKGPEDRAWVDIQQPLWASWYTGSYFCKTPAPLAVVSLGVSDTRSNYARISRFSSPFDTRNKPELINPEQLMAGHFDLAFVLVFLSPLLLLLLSFDILGYERDEGMLPLIPLQAGSLAAWAGLRVGFQWSLAFAATAVLWLMAAWAAGSWGLSLWLGLLLSGLYLLFWGGLILLVLSMRQGLSFNALTLAILWMVVSILLPAAANLWGQAQYPHDYSTEITDAQRADRYALYDKEAEELEPQLFEVFPEARHSAYVQDTVRDPLIDRHYYDVAGLLLNEAAAAEAVATEAGRERLARKSTWYNPAYAMQMGLDAVAGNSSAAYLAFNADISAAVKAKVVQLLAFALEKEPLDAEKFQVLRQTVGPNPNYAGQVPGRSWLVLLLYTVLIGGIGVWRLRKG
jgi:ABC-2 type transport system permease protein